MNKIENKDEIPNWSFVDTFNLYEIQSANVPNWKPSNELVAHGKAAVAVAAAPLQKLLAVYHERFSKLGGDPFERDWEDFRPLRLNREEDWSDWLGFLIETSRNGFLSSELLGSSNKSRKTAKGVDREFSTADDARRADLVVYWSNGINSHVEVKVGDKNFEKTFETSLGLRQKAAH